MLFVTPVQQVVRTIDLKKEIRFNRIIYNLFYSQNTEFLQSCQYIFAKKLSNITYKYLYNLKYSRHFVLVFAICLSIPLLVLTIYIYIHAAYFTDRVIRKNTSIKMTQQTQTDFPPIKSVKRQPTAAPTQNVKMMVT